MESETLYAGRSAQNTAQPTKDYPLTAMVTDNLRTALNHMETPIQRLADAHSRVFGPLPAPGGIVGGKGPSDAPSTLEADIGNLLSVLRDRIGTLDFLAEQITSRL